MKKRVGWLCLVLTGILLCGCAPKKQASTIYMGDVLAIAGVKTGDSMKVGFIDPQGQWVIEPKYEQAEPFSQGMAAVKENGKWGYISPAGAYVIEPQFDRAFSFRNNRAPVYESSQSKVKEYFINPKGEKVFEIQTGENGWYGDFVEDRLLVCKEGKYGFLDPEGNEAVPFIYDEACDFNQGLALVYKDEKYGCVDKNGKEIVPVVYEAVLPINEDRIIAYTKYGVYTGSGLKSHCNVLDGTGKLIFEFDGVIYAFVNGIAMFDMQEGIFTEDEPSTNGYVTKDGKVLLKSKNFSTYGFWAGRAQLVEKNNQGEYEYRVIDESMNTICTERDIIKKLTKKYDYYRLSNYDESGYAALKVSTDTGKKDEYGYPTYDEELIVLDRQGEIVAGPIALKENEYYEAYHPESGVITEYYPENSDYNLGKVAKIMGYRFIRPDGTEKEITVDINYPIDYHHSLWAVEKDGKWGYLDPRGEWAIEPTFDWADAFLPIR